MRFLLLPLLLIFSGSLKAQWKTYRLTAKGDTINCTDMQGLKQGKWKIQVAPLRGERGYEEEGSFRNDQREGVWRRFSMMGDVLAVENYKWGQKNGICRYFTIAGLEHEESWLAVNPAKAYDTIDVQDLADPNKYEQVVVKTTGNSLKHGTWRFYYPETGQIVKTEHWLLDQIREAGMDAIKSNGLKKASDSLSAGKKDTLSTKIKPKEVLDFEKKNAGKKKTRVRDGRTGG